MSVSAAELLSPAQLATQRFVDEHNLSLLDEKPISFDTTPRFASFLCCAGACGAILSCCVTPLCCPLTMCPGKYLYPEYALSLDADSINFSTAANDCCWHVARQAKTVPLDKVQDVQLSESWVHTLFGLTAVNIETAGQSGGGGANGAAAAPEVSAAFLADPAGARDAIRLAVKLARERQRGGGGGGSGGASSAAAGPSAAAAGGGGGFAVMAPAQVVGGMSRAGAADADTLVGRLTALRGLVGCGVLSTAEASTLRVAVLTAPHDPTRRLSEAGELRDRGLVTVEEFAAIKRALLRQLREDGDEGGVVVGK